MDCGVRHNDDKFFVNLTALGAEAFLAILSLSGFAQNESVRVWNSMDWDVMNLQFENGWISDPVGKQKSVILTEEGAKLAEEYLAKYFGD